MSDDLRARARRASRSWVVIVVLAVVVGLLIAPFAWQLTAAPAADTGTVAVVPIAGIIDGETTADASNRLVEARTDPSVDAVVLVVNSPGGIASASEELQMQVDRTAQEKPVVAVVDGGAASGAYGAILPSEEIYAKPTSLVGSVGTMMVLPDQSEPTERIIQSGPDKLDGQSERGFEYSVAMTTEAFLDDVVDNRGDRLELSRNELAHAKVYNGIQAVEYGLADDIGDVQRAIQVAADSAGLSSYEIETMQYETEVTFISQPLYASADVPEKTLAPPETVIDPQGDAVLPTVLYLPPGALSDTGGALDESERGADRDERATEREDETDEAEDAEAEDANEADATSPALDSSEPSGTDPAAVRQGAAEGGGP